VIGRKSAATNGRLSSGIAACRSAVMIGRQGGAMIGSQATRLGRTVNRAIRTVAAVAVAAVENEIGSRMGRRGIPLPRAGARTAPEASRVHRNANGSGIALGVIGMMCLNPRHGLSDPR
jgi:hypothetical protein